jgi:membrane protein implicated in regulation of membrane protease activity
VVERLLAFAAGLLLLYLAPLTMALGGALLVVALGLHLVRRRLSPAVTRTSEGTPS